ncbi:hypothetical protein EYC84_009955 [Monilinia fructicola]|uniref:Uncharacterized protein n=1 Tax=Monilinia fructicola TaxID=38448 RepID=A0A5M9JGJ0_MONFR|nr:hypothetical protein EYC84_009955 [Monilinia fructicola]
MNILPTPSRDQQPPTRQVPERQDRKINQITGPDDRKTPSAYIQDTKTDNTLPSQSMDGWAETPSGLDPRQS